MVENDQLYAQACFPVDQWSIAGIQLLPMRVGHVLNLQSVNSPFLDFETPEFKDLMVGLWVCSQPVEPGINTATEKLPFSWRVKSWFLSQVAERDYGRIWASIAAFQQYAFESLWFRPPIAKKNDGLYRESSCPSLLPMIRALMNHYGYCEWEVLNMPLKKAKMQHAGWLEHEGALEFKTPKDDDIIDKLKSPEFLAWDKKVRAEAAKKQAAKK